MRKRTKQRRAPGVIEEIPVDGKPIPMQPVTGFGCGTSGRTPDGPSTSMYIQFELPSGAKSPAYCFEITNLPAFCQMLITAVERSESRQK